ncbi:MAG: DUF2500 domain-containing protein [Propionibacteriaceae bacterium]|jgi:hypothetical protein|nr:DUF2500 domain-containing protein [Propionibacteriaceae bacterium]
MAAVSITVILVVFVALIALIVVGVVLSGSKARRERQFNMKAPLVNSPARVVDERSAITGTSGQYGGSTSTSYFATFELPDGQRLEFAIDGVAAGQIVAGDTGTLYWQGTWFKGFQREILR